jgi:hypothetical protein
MKRSVLGLFLGLLLGLVGAAQANSVFIDFTGDNVVSQGLTQANNSPGNDGFTRIVKRCDRNTAATGGSSSARYLYLKIDDAFKQNLTSVWATVTYFETGTKGFTLEFDGTRGANTNYPPFTRLQYDSETFVSQTWHLAGFKLQGRQTGGADLRLNDGGASPVYIARVEVSDTDPNLIHFPYSTKPPAIDGQIDSGEWDGAYTVKLDNPRQDGFRTASMLTMPEQFHATYSFQYDESAFYILGQVVDATPRLNTTSNGIDYWNGDAIELFLGLDDSNPERMNFKSGTDFQVMVGLGEKPGWGLSTHGNRADKSLDPIGNNLAIVNTTNGYLFELQIPWTLLNSSLTVKQGQRIAWYMFADNSTVTPSQQEVALGPTGVWYAAGIPFVWTRAVLDPKP